MIKFPKTFICKDNVVLYLHVELAKRSPQRQVGPSSGHFIILKPRCGTLHLNLRTLFNRGVFFGQFDGILQ